MSVEKLVPDINAVRAQFEAWRATRIGRAAIPENLWAAAIALLEYYPARIVCQQLRLSPKQLRQRREELLGITSQPKVRRHNSRQAKFLELTGEQLTTGEQSLHNNQSTPSAQVLGQVLCQLVLEKKDLKLTISLPLDRLNNFDWTKLTMLLTNLLRV